MGRANGVVKRQLHWLYIKKNRRNEKGLPSTVVVTANRNPFFTSRLQRLEACDFVYNAIEIFPHQTIRCTLEIRGRYVMPKVVNPYRKGGCAGNEPVDVNTHRQ